MPINDNAFLADMQAEQMKAAPTTLTAATGVPPLINAAPEALPVGHGLRKELEAVINKHSAENGSDTPDFILAAFLADSLAAFDRAVRAREKWHGR